MANLQNAALTATNAGAGIGGFFGNLFGGISAPVKNLLGETKTTETIGQSEQAAANKRTATIVIAVLGIITLITVGYFLIKNKS